MNWLLPYYIWFGPDRDLYRSLRNILGFYPSNISVYKLAFSHRSAVSDSVQGLHKSNERLEYLGDAVLGAVVAELLFKKYPFRDEGFLTEMRSRIVSRDNLKNLAVKIGLDKYVVNNSGPGMHRSMYGDAFEALVGAIFIDKGFECARKFVVNRILHVHIDLEEVQKADTNYKSKIINWAQKERRKISFEMIDEGVGGRLIRVQLFLDGEIFSEGEDYVRKKAEQIASLKALEKLGLSGE